MTSEEAKERFGGLVADWFCTEAYVGRFDGKFYYRYESAHPVTEAGQIKFYCVADDEDLPGSPIGAKEFHEAQKGFKLK